MSVNPHDDYEALAKLLYPSIEASGNVYYGQTRKLTIDELFDKNSNGFESYFCSCRKEDDSSQYEQHFYWKLGPFSDTVKVVDDTYRDYPLAWLKYTLIKKETEHTNKLSAGEYSTYDVEYILGKPTLYCSLDGLLPDGNIYNSSNFFLDENAKILYVLLYKAPVYEDMDKPLYIEALTDDITVRLVRTSAVDHGQCEYKYGFDHTDLTNDLTLDERFAVKKGRRIYIRCENRPQFNSTAYLRIEIESSNDSTDSTEVAVGGNIESMAKFENGGMLDYAYHSLFYNSSLITDTSRLYIGKISKNGCSYLFGNCSRLKKAPAILPCFELKTNCFSSMFFNCVELENAPILPARNGIIACYSRMFECYFDDVDLKLNRIICLLNQWDRNYTMWWLSGREDIEIYILPDSNWDSDDSSALPEDCRIEELESTIYTSIDYISVRNTLIEKYLITHGTNNENNGRGDITDPFTLANMEKSFDENNNHPMNTYNYDGSFNQEIWGYKSFCSPVQFRNGIYTDTLSILSIYDSNSISYTKTGSTIKSVEIDGLEINLKNEKGIDYENVSFSVPLHGYEKPGKRVKCTASLTSTSDYEYNDEICVGNSTVLSETIGTVAQSSITAHVTTGSRGSAFASVSTLIDSNEPTIDLSVVDYRGNESIDNKLIISKTGSKFTGGVEADDVTAEGITTDNIYVDGILHLGDAEISLDNDNLVISAPNSIAINTYTEMIDGLYVEGNFSTIDGLECGGDSSFMGVITADSGITSHGNITIIGSGKKFVGDLDGVIPHVESFSSKTVPIGCIVLIRIIKSEPSGLTPPLAVGSMLTSGNSSTYELSIGCFSETGINANNSSDPLAEGQTFRTLSQCLFSANGVTHALAIRVK